jgi:hypothetical protein
VTTPPGWEAWAPPLDPPTAGGLPVSEAEAIAAAWWDTDPHLAAALQWEAYAATQPPALPVAQVNTGVQSVSYGRAIPGGPLGEALSRAAWHRTLAATIASAPLRPPVPRRAR